MKKTIFTMLALLMTAATGAWAEDYLYLEVDGTSATVKYGADKGSNPYYREDPDSPGSYGWYVPKDAPMPDQVTDYSDKNTLTTVTIDASCQNYTGTTLERFFGYWTSLTTINNLENLNTSEVTDMSVMFTACRSMTSFDLSGLNTAKVTNMEYMFNSVSVETLDLSSFNTSSVTNMYCMFYNCSNLSTIYVGDGWSTASVTNGTLMFGSCTNLPGFDSGKTSHEMAKLTTDGGYLTYKAPDVDLTLNAAKTVATMEMPTYDVTIDYELVRDMAVDMPITVGTGQDNYRIRVKKEGDSFVPAEMTLQQMMALFNVHDGIENQDLVFYGDGKVCDISIFAVDDQGQPTGDAIAFQSLTPGRYVAIATAQEGTIYDGQTGQSNIFTLFEGFEVEVAAQGFATYYKDEALTLDTDETAAALYTVSSVTANEAVLSNAIEAAPANTPLLIYNSSNEPKTVLLIPTDEPNLALTVAPEFQGTLEAKTFTADDMAAYNHYMLTEANAFVWVREAGTIAANRCWLQIAASAPTKARKLVFGEATGLKAIDNGERTIDNWYDLNGRKLNAVPTKKGVYIMNGKKVVVK